MCIYSFNHYMKGAFMKVISVLNQKGGSGKTTIATNLAMCFYEKYKDVILIDSDPQGSSRDWHAVDENNPLKVIGIDRPTIQKGVEAFKNSEIKYVIIDGAPQASNLAISAITASDLIIIPVQPSPYDIWATDDLVEIVKNRIELTDGKLKACFLISRAINGTNIGEEIKEALQGYDLPILETVIHQRIIYPNSAINGKTVIQEDKKSLAAVEMKNLFNEIEKLLGNK